MNPIKPIILRLSLLNLCLLLLGLSPVVNANEVEEDKDDGTQTQQVSADSLNQSKKHLSFGFRYLRNKQYEDAETQLNKSWSYNPYNPKTAYYLGRIYYETEKYDEAIPWFGRTIEMAPKSVNTKNAHYYLAQIYTLQENRPGAIQAYEALMTFQPDRDREIQYLHYLVSLYVEEGDYEAAKKYAGRWGELEPDNPDVQDMIGKLALSTGEEDEAMAQMEKLIQMNASDYVTLERLADMYRKRGEISKAFDAYEKLHNNTPSNFLYLDYLLELGQKMGKSRNFQIQILEKMHQLQPNNLRVVESLADMKGSIDMVNKGLRLDPNNGKLNYLKGDYYYKRWKASTAKEDSVQALRWFEKAISDPQWRGNAQRMINEINPPLSDEEKKLREFFKKKETKEEVKTEGKK